MPWIRSAAAAVLIFGAAVPCVADEEPAPPATSHATSHVLAASDEVGGLLFPKARRAGADRRRLAEDERRPAPPADRSVTLRDWLARYGQVVVNDR
jgi:hypothetical protein